MKIKRISRAMSFLLVIAMCIPMIVIPSFAAESSVSEEEDVYLYENTFETYTEGHTWTAADNYFEINPNNKLSGATSKHTVIKNPEDTSDLVWSFPMESANNQNHLYLATNGFSYTITPKIIFELDFYVPEDAYGSFFLEFRSAKYTGGSGNPSALAIKMGTSSSTADTVVLEDRQNSSNYKQHTIHRGEWYHLSYAWNMVNGTYRTCLNEELVFSGKRYTNVDFTNASFADVNLYSYNTYCGAWGGNLLIDDIRISDNSAKYFPVYENTFESYTVGNAMSDTSSGKGFSSDLSSLGYTVAADPKNTDNKVLGVPVSDAAADNYKAATTEYTSPSDYKDAVDFTFTEDIYIPSDAVGSAKIQGWERYSADSNVWHDFFYINFTTASSAATVEFPSNFAYSVKGSNLKLNRDTWYHLTVSLKQTTGDMTVLIDGEIVFVGNLGAPINIAQFFIARMRTASACGATLNGTIYLDNIRIYKEYFKNGEMTETRTYKWSNDFEKYTVDALITDTSSGSGFSSSLAQTYKCTTTYDPLNAENKVMNVPTENGNNYVGQTYDWRNQGDSYTKMTHLVFEQDIYIPGATTGKTRVQGWQKIPSEGFRSFYDIDFSTANEDAMIIPIGTTSYVGALALSRDTWHKTTFSLVQSTGEYYILIDGNVAAVGILGNTSMQLCTYFFFRAYAGASGSVYLDNMHIYEGFDKGVMHDSALYRNTFESYTKDFEWSSADSYFDANVNAPITDASLKHKVVSDPTNADNLVWQIPLTEANLNNNKAYLSSASSVDYQKTSIVTLSMKVYVPAGAKGDVKMQGHSDAEGFNDLYHILMKGTSASVWVDDSVAYTGDLNLTLDQWHNIDYALNLVSGEFKLMIDGVIAYSGNIGLKNRVWDGWIIAKLQSTDRVSEHNGTMLVDDIVIEAALADGEMATTSYLYENTMEQYWSEYVLEGDAWFSSNINDGNHGHMIVTDPTNAANKVWKVPMGAENADNVNSALKIGNNAISYSNTPHIVFEIDMYVPTGATGSFQMEAWSRDRSDSFQYFYTVNVTSVGAKIAPYGTYSYAGENLELARDTWYKIAFALDMVTGGYTIYVDGDVAATGITGQTNLLVSNDSFMIAKVESSRAGTGYVLFDDLLIYKGEKPMNVVLGDETSEDFSDLDGGVYIPTVNDAAQMKHSVYSYTVYDQIVLQADYFIDGDAEGVLESKFNSYRYLVSNIWGIGKELSLYSIDLSSGKIYQKQQPTIYGNLNVGEKNTVTAVLDLNTGAYSVYVNGFGAFNAKVGHTNLTLGADESQYWQIVSVASNTLTGTVYADNASIRLLGDDELILINTDSDKTLKYIDVTVGGKTVRTGVSSLFMPADTSYTAEAAYFNTSDYSGIITTEQKISIRLKQDSGLRFATLINDKESFDELFSMAGEEIADVYFSTLITPVDYLNAVDQVFTKEALKTLVGVNSGITYLDVKGTHGYYISEALLDNDPSTTHFVGSIVNIKQQNYDRSFAAIGYVEVLLLTGEVITLYSSQWHSSNIKSAALLVRNAGDGYYDSLDEKNKALIDSFADYMAPVTEIVADSIPTLSTEGSLTATTFTEENGTYYVYKNVTVNEIAAYKDALLNAGFTLYTSHNLDSAEFATYTGNTKSVRLFCYPAESEFRILVTDLAYLPEREKPTYEAIEGLVPTDTMIKSNGVDKIGAMSHVLQFVDGSFAVVDGGCEDAEDAYNLLTYLWENKPASDAKPRVTWFLTHAHNDHVDLPNSFLEAYHEFINLEMVVYNYPDYDTFTVTYKEAEHSRVRQERIERILSEYYPNTVKYICHTGDKLYLPGCTVDILMTYLDFYPDTFAGINETCAVFKFTFDSGYELLITGDIYPNNCSFLTTNYPTVLKSDVVQTPHHGRDGADAAFYNAIVDELKILMWSNSATFFEERAGSANDAYDWSFNSIVLDAAGVSHYNASQTVTVNMNDLSVTVK